MLIPKFFKNSVNQVMNADLSDSDKIANLIEMLEPYHLENKVQHVYTPKQMQRKLHASSEMISSDKMNKDLKAIKPYLKQDILASKHYLELDNGAVKSVNDKSVKNVKNQVLYILKHSDE